MPPPLCFWWKKSALWAERFQEAERTPCGCPPPSQSYCLFDTVTPLCFFQRLSVFCVGMSRTCSFHFRLSMLVKQRTVGLLSVLTSISLTLLIRHTMIEDPRSLSLAASRLFVGYGVSNITSEIPFGLMRSFHEPWKIRRALKYMT